MTTMEANTFGSLIALKLAKALARKESRTQARSQVQIISRFVLTVFGFGCLTQAGFTWSTLAGWVTMGICALVMSTLFTGGSKPEQNPNPGNHFDRR